jgi:hypothetical protein
LLCPSKMTTFEVVVVVFGMLMATTDDDVLMDE